VVTIVGREKFFVVSQDSKLETKIRAWQPLTPRGVAAFARAPLRRLLLAQFIFAVLMAATAAWFLETAWFPAIREAIRNLPEQGEIRSGKLNWPGDSPLPLVEGHFLAFTVDLDHSGGMRSPAHVGVEFGRNDVRIFSLLGYSEWPYPPDNVIAFNRVELQPWWGAWRPPILWMTAGGVLAGFMIFWTLLATVYFFPAWLAGFFANRDLNLRQSWKLAGAALLPGTVLVAVAVFFYGIGALDLVQLAAAGGASTVAGWIFLFAGVLASPKLSSATTERKNPFAIEKV